MNNLHGALSEHDLVASSAIWDGPALEDFHTTLHCKSVCSLPEVGGLYEKKNAYYKDLSLMQYEGCILYEILIELIPYSLSDMEEKFPVNAHAGNGFVYNEILHTHLVTCYIDTRVVFYHTCYTELDREELDTTLEKPLILRHLLHI